MDVVVKARHCNVTEQFRAYVAEKITRLEKLDDRIIRVEVELSAERNKRQHDQASRVEITVRTKGPVVRAESAAEDKTAAFDLALDRSEEHTSELQSRQYLVCRLLLDKKINYYTL